MMSDTARRWASYLLVDWLCYAELAPGHSAPTPIQVAHAARDIMCDGNYAKMREMRVIANKGKARMAAMCNG